ncbi:MAG: hypothetical protein ACQERK_02665 [Campylobacterota bacterium]
MKILVAIVLFCSLVWADTLDDVVQDLVDQNQYEKHKVLIDALFEKKERFMIAEQVDVVEVAKVLKENGLLKLFYEQPTMTHVKFTSSSKPKLFLKLLNDILQQIGFTYYFIENVKYDDGKITWQIKYRGDYAIDPLLLSRRLEAHGVKIASMKKEAYNRFSYGLNMHDAQLDVKKLIPGERFEITRAIEDIMLDVSFGRYVVFRPQSGSFWYPEVILYDKDLNIIDIIEHQKIKKTLYVDLGRHVKYISVSDLYLLENLKGGLSVELKGER